MNYIATAQHFLSRVADGVLESGRNWPMYGKAADLPAKGYNFRFLPL